MSIGGDVVIVIPILDKTVPKIVKLSYQPVLILEI
jgi:hypothetical protein